MASGSVPLFYPAGLARQDLLGLVSRVQEILGLDVVDFPDEGGGDAGRELAVPYLPGMDDIQVDQAQIKLQAQPKDLDIISYKVTAAPNNQGIFLSLEKPASLKKVELSFSPPANIPGPFRLVVRQAQKKNGGFATGPPIFAAPSFPAPGPMFASVFGGMSVQALGGNRTLLILPSVRGDAWQIQLATGDSPTNLAPQAFSPQVNRVVLEAVPENLTISMPSDQGPVTLWSHPNALLPGVGVQEVNFTPMAQKHLADALKATPSGQDPLTLAVPINFHSDGGSAIGISEKTLTARYLARPLGSDPTILRLGGSLTPLSLSAPAGLRPQSSTVNLTARLLGRELNPGSPFPPLTATGVGWRVTSSRCVAVALPFLPRPGADPGSTLNLASVRLLLSSLGDGEAVLEIREDAASAPGPRVLMPPVVRQIKAGFADWLEFELSKPLALPTGDTPLWLALRATKGDLLWFAENAGSDAAPPPGPQAGAPRVSGDKGQSWSVPEAALAAVRRPFAQLFHQCPEPFSPPLIQVRGKEAIFQDNWVTSLVQKTPKEFAASGLSLPQPVLELLAATSGPGRAATGIYLYSASVLDLTVENLTFFYDPFQAVKPGA